MKHVTQHASTTVYVVRHSQSLWNGTKRISGQCNPPLSPKGLGQSRALARALHHIPLTAIYTSTLSRTIETARPTALDHHLEIQALDALKEIHFGDLQGRFRDERDPEAQRIWQERSRKMLEYRVPGGETFPELINRILPRLEDILQQQQGGTILIVGHRSVNRVLLGTFMEWPEETLCDIKVRSQFVYEISLGESPSMQTIILKANGERTLHDGFLI